MDDRNKGEKPKTLQDSSPAALSSSHSRPPSFTLSPPIKLKIFCFPIPLDVSFRCQSTMIKPSMTWRMPSNLKKWTISKTSTLTSSSYTRCSCLPLSSWHAALSLLLTCSLNHRFQITNIYWRRWVTWNSMKVTMQLTSWHLQRSWRRSFRMELWEAIYTLLCIRQVRVSSNGGC